MVGEFYGRTIKTTTHVKSAQLPPASGMDDRKGKSGTDFEVDNVSGR